MGFDEQALTAQFLDKDFVDFCNKMFNPDPNQRMKSVGEMMSHPYMQGPTYTNEQAVQSLHQRQQQYFAQQAVDIGQLDINNVSSDSPQGSFRDVSLDVLERFKIKDFYAEIEEAYPDIRSLLREVVDYSKARSGMKSVLTKSSVQDMFEFLAMVLPTEFVAQIKKKSSNLTMKNISSTSPGKTPSLKKLILSASCFASTGPETTPVPLNSIGSLVTRWLSTRSSKLSRLKSSTS